MNRERRLFVRLTKQMYKECQRRAKAAGARNVSGHVREVIKLALDQPDSLEQIAVVAGPFDGPMMAIGFPDEDRDRIAEAAERECQRSGRESDESTMARLLLYRGMVIEDRNRAEDAAKADNGRPKIRRAG